MADSQAHSGGCQCGAVRFRVTRLGRPSICHCRMCQKAFGGFFGPLVTGLEFSWTCGAPKYFASSDAIRRGFCADCGTPLTYESDTYTEFAIGAFDDPEVARPEIQVNAGHKLSYTDHLHELPSWSDEKQAERSAYYATLKTHQHPDHDTADWPRGRRPDGSLQDGGERRLPMRRCALPRHRNARQFPHLPLPHVPEGGRQYFRRAGGGAP